MPEDTSKVEGLPRWIECTDSRDGYIFTFHTSSFKMRPGSTDKHYVIELIDAQGRKRYLNEVDDSFMTCVERLAA